MESQLQHTHGRHYDDSDTLTVGDHPGHDHYEDEEHHEEKKSVIRKVKEKAKKIKNTITKHGHSHGGHDHHEEDDDDDDEETVEDPEVHGAPMYDSARVGQGAGLGSTFSQPRGNLERRSVMAEDRYPEPVASHGAPPHFSTGSEPLGVGHDRAYGQEKWSSKIGESTGMDDEPFAPNPTRISSPTGVTEKTYGTRLEPDPASDNRGGGQDVNQLGLRGVIGKETGIMVPDPHAPKDQASLSLGSDPSNYETKVANPTHTGGNEAELSQLQHSFDKMGIDTKPKTFDPNHPENLPHETLPSSQSSNKISSTASAIASKAATAKDAIASKLGYSGQNPTPTQSHESDNNPGSTADYAHKITDKVTGTLAPVYEKVVDAGSSVISQVQASVTGSGQQQVQRGSETSTVTDKGVSVKEHLVETLRPGDEDKALSEVITHALHRGKEEEYEKRSREDRPLGVVTESEEVRRRLGTGRREERQDSGSVIADRGVADRLIDAMGSWFGGKGDASQGTLGTSYVTDEGLSSNPIRDRNRGRK